MGKTTRRNFVLSMGAVGAATSTIGWPVPGHAKTSGGRVVVIGGGFGGASCAKYLRRLSDDIDVTLVERDSKFMTCPFSNAVLGGLYDMDFITHGYDALRDKHDWFTAQRRDLARERPLPDEAILELELDGPASEIAPPLDWIGPCEVQSVASIVMLPSKLSWRPSSPARPDPDRR